MKEMEIIRSIQEIKPMIESSELGEALNSLLVVTQTLEVTDLNSELILTKSRYNENKRNNRKGIIAKDDYDKENNKLRNNILEIYLELEAIPNINSELRRKMKALIMAQRRLLVNAIIIEYSKITSGTIGKIEFPPNDFKDFGDFLNAVYLEMYQFVPPFTYGEKWVLSDEYNQTIDYMPSRERETTPDTRKLFDVLPSYETYLQVQPV